MTEPDVRNVCAVIVTYRPDPVILRDLLDAMAVQVEAVVVVDNTATGDMRQFGYTLPDRAVILHQASNVGLAVAQNLGINWAREHGYRHVLLMDQDSTPGVGMVDALLDALTRLSIGKRVAAVGARFHDLREDRDAPFIRVGFPLNRKLWCECSRQTIKCDFLISSGTLIPLEVLDQVGGMDAGLFIDNVDLEWSFRARAKGYTLHGVCAATMNHRLGDARRGLPFGLGPVVVHGPARLYYMMRNRVHLYRLRHTPRVWVAQDVPRVLVKLLLFGVLIGPRLRNVQLMLRGLGDGLRGRQGPCPWYTDA